MTSMWPELAVSNEIALITAPLNGDDRSAVGARSTVAGFEIVAPTPKILKPETRRSSSLKPWPPPKLKAAEPETENACVTAPLNGMLIPTVAFGIVTLTTPDGESVKSIAPLSCTTLPRLITAAVVVVPTLNFSTNAEVGKTTLAVVMPLEPVI